jgi:hypothetical protein
MKKQGGDEFRRIDQILGNVADYKLIILNLLILRILLTIYLYMIVLMVYFAGLNNFLKMKTKKFQNSLGVWLKCDHC